MHGNVIGFVVFDLVLRIVFRRVMDVTLVVHVFAVNFDDFSAGDSCLGIPAHMVADFEFSRHANLQRSCLNERLSVSSRA
jgi:hypothetical protein